MTQDKSFQTKTIATTAAAGVATIVVAAGSVAAFNANWSRIGQMPVGKVGGAALALGAGWFTVGALRRLYDTVYQRVRDWQRDGIEIRTQEMQSRIHVLHPDQYGRQGIAFDGEVYRDLDTLAVFRQEFTAFVEPVMEELRWQHARIQALTHQIPPNSYHYENIIGDQVSPGQEAAELETGEAAPSALANTTIGTLLSKYRHTPRLHSILIGEYVDDQGQVQPLTLDIPKSVHVLGAGAPGLGKSTLLETIALQLATLPDVELAVIDFGSGTFDAIEPHAHWPLADDGRMATAMLKELARICEHRRQLWADTGARVRSLEQYNAVSGQAEPFIACCIDETPMLLEDDSAKQALIDVGRYGRKYGLGLLLFGTDFNADTIPSKVRGHCQARLAFWLERGLSMSAIGSSAAHQLSGQPGEIVAKRPGYGPLVRGRTPDVIDADYALLAHKPAAAKATLDPATDEQPQTAQSFDEVDDATLSDEERVRRLHAAGASLNEIQRRVCNGIGGNYYYYIRNILDQQGQEDAASSNNNNGGDDD